MVSISSSKSLSPVNWSRKESGLFSVAVTQTTDLTANSAIKFNTVLKGNMEFNPATYRVTLKANKTYKMRSSILARLANDTGYLYIMFYDVTNSAWLGVRGNSIPPNYSTSRNSIQPLAVAEITPTTNIVVECRIQAVASLENIQGDATLPYSFWEIQELDTFSPNTQKWDYAYVSPQVDLSVTGQAGFTLVSGKGVFYKTNNGVWRLEFNIGFTQTSSATADITISGVIFKYSQACSAYAGVSNYTRARVNAGDGGVPVKCGSETTVFYVSGYVELASKPTGYAIPSDV